jgi:hypothetical protein
MPSSPGKPRSTAVLSWFQLSLHDPTLFTTSIYHAISHQRLYWLTKGKTGNISWPQDTQTLANFELESIKEVNKAIQNPSRSLRDAVIMSVGCLANSSRDELLLDKNIRSPFQSPLRSLQWLDIYGIILPNRVHLTGLAQLVKLRGGLDMTSLPGLAPALS